MTMRLMIMGAVALALGGCVSTQELHARQEAAAAAWCKDSRYAPGTALYLDCMRTQAHIHAEADAADTARRQQAMSDFGDSLQRMGAAMQSRDAGFPRQTTCMNTLPGMVQCNSY